MSSNIRNGLPNFGNTCFINSALQLLYSISEVKDFIINFNENNKSSSIINSLKKIFLLLSKNSVISNYYIIDNDILNLYKKSMNNGIKSSKRIPQQDSQEFLSNIIDYLCETSGNLKEYFIYYFKTISYCKNSNNTIYGQTPRDDISLLLSLEIPELNNITLQYLINNQILQEKESDTNITNNVNQPNGKKIALKRCSEGHKSYRLTTIDIPDNNKYMMIQLKRMKYISIRESIFLDKYIYINKKITFPRNNEIDKVNYILIGAILKTGTVNSGHYIYVTFNNGRISKVYNDDMVSNQLGNFNINKNAYILLYKKYENNNSGLEQINETNFKKMLAESRLEQRTTYGKIYTKYEHQINNLKKYIDENISNINKKSSYFLFHKYIKLFNNSYNNELNYKLEGLDIIIDILTSSTIKESNIPFQLGNYNINSIIKQYKNDTLKILILTILKVNSKLFDHYSVNIDKLSKLIKIILNNNDINSNINTIKKMLIS